MNLAEFIRGLLHRPSARSESVSSVSHASSGEKRLKSILEAVLDAVVTADEKGRIMDFNAAAEKIFQYSREEVIGKNLSLLMPEPDRSLHDSYMRSYLEGGEPRIIGKKGREVVGMRKDGTTFPLDLSVNEIPESNQRLFVGILRDITERKLMQDGLVEAKKAAEAANEAKSRFLAAMSHEIRTPMNGALGMIELLLHTDLSDEQRSYVETALSSNRTLMRILNEVLDFSRLNSREYEVECVEFSIRTLAREVIGLMKPTADKRNLYLKSSLEEDFPEKICGDPDRLRQILLNLLNNGLKFTQEGGVTLAVSLAKDMDGKPNMILRVADTGIGIEKSMQETIFNDFTQADDGLSRAYGGVGLGLAIVRRLVASMGGRIYLESEPGRGSVFVVHLPVKTTPEKIPEA